VTLYTADYNPKPGLIAGTFSGSTATLSAGLEILNILDNDGYMGPSGKVMKIHNEFMSMLKRLSDGPCKGHLQDAEGMGLMIAVTPFGGVKEKVDKLTQVLFKNGLVCFTCGRGTYRLRFLIPAVITSDDIRVAGEILEKSVLEMA